MSAIALSCFLILYWTLLGFALLSIFKNRTHFHLRLLVAPCLGLAASIITLFVLSRIGFPIRPIAIPLFVAGALLAGYVGFTKKTIWKRRAFHMQQLLMIVAILPFAWPLIKFGFEWLAFVNGDMSYYSLSASRFLDYGYSELPASGNIYDDRDYSLSYWFFPNKLGHRAGADMLLAQVVGVSGLTAHQAFMPLIIACHACVVAGAGALTLLGSHRWSSALWAMVLAALSPMLTLEVTKQLLAQAIGLALLTSLCVAYVQGTRVGQARLWSTMAIVLTSGLAIAYSELLPFFALFVAVYELTRWNTWLDKKTRNYRLCKIGFMVLGCVFLLNAYLFDVVKFILIAADGSFKSSGMTIQADGLSLFPHFFVPSGSAVLFGWLPFGIQAVSVAVLVGLAALILFAMLALIASKKGVPSAQMSVVMLAVAISMYVGGNGFGLFKLSMFIQPFLMSTIVILAALFLTRHVLQRAALTLLGASFLPAQIQNVVSVSGDLGDIRVPYASTARLGEQLRALSDSAKLVNNIHIYSDTPVRELFLLQSYYFKNIPFDAASLPSLREFLAEKFEKIGSIDLLKVLQEKVEEQFFYFDQIATGTAAKFKVSKKYDANTDYLLTSSREFSPINRSNSTPGEKLFISPLNKLKNHLVFRHSSLGSSYVGKNWTDGTVGYWGIEADPLFKGETMAAVGRYHLYQVMGSSDGSRVLMALTTSMNMNDDFLLPNVKAVGATDTLLPLVGRGSARVISPPVNSRKISGSDYLGIDLGRNSSLLKIPRAGAMGLFGNSIKLDIRKMVAFARDISYISSEQYAAIQRPLRLQDFPATLANPGLEYSGIFEDGWISEVAYAIFKSPQTDKPVSLHLAGSIPNINNAPFNPIIKLSINGRGIYNAHHAAGQFDLSIPVPSEYLKSDEPVKVQIESSALQRLPGGDGRPVSIHLELLGF